MSLAVLSEPKGRSISCPALSLERVEVSKQQRVPLYVKSGMSFCTWDGGLKTDVSQRKDKRGLPWQAYAQGNFGAVRKENGRVVELVCA